MGLHSRGSIRKVRSMVEVSTSGVMVVRMMEIGWIIG